MGNKLHLGLGMILLVCFLYKNYGFERLAISKKNSLYDTKTTTFKISKSNSQEYGKEIYNDFCIQCHGASGKGDGINFPPLAYSDWLTKKRKQSIHAIKFGLKGEIVVNKMKFNTNMPAMGLSNIEVAAVTNYIMNNWGNKQKNKVTEKEVEGVLY